MRSITLDIETTGIDPFKGHKIIEIGCVELYNNTITGNVWHTFVNPEREIPPAAYKIHGIGEKFLKDKAIFADIANDFLSFIEGSSLIVHNASFDIAFLNYELEKINKKNLLQFEIIDTLALAKRLFLENPINLASIGKRYKIDITNRNKYGTLSEAEILADIYLKMLDEKQ